MTAGVCPYDQLEPRTWRALLARAAVFRAIRARLGRLWDLADQPDVRNVLSRLDEAVRRYTPGDEDDEGIVARVARDWDEQLASTLDLPDLDGAARTLLGQVRELVATACCDDPFSALFAPIASQARELYGTAWRPARLSVAHTRSHPRHPDNARHDPYGLTAMTPWPPEPADPQIELQIWADGFGPAAYAAVPMVLTHECVCHVPARQDRARNDSEFAEGFLDWAAYHFFRIWAGKVDPQFASATRQHAERLKQVLAGQPASSETQARLVGHHAAEELQSWFESRHAMGPEESRALVARLAVELNKADRPLVDKDHFVSVLGLPMPPEVARLLDSWLDGLASADELLDVRLAG